MRGETLCVALSLALLTGAWSSPAGTQAGKLPEVPTLLAPDAYPGSLRAELMKAYAAAIANPRDASANGRLGVVLHACGHIEEAEVSYQRAHLLDPKSFRWAYLLGIVYAQRGNFDQGASAFREALHLDPGYLPAGLKLGECLLASGKWQEAAKFYEGMVAKQADRPEPYCGLGRVRAIRNDLNGAVESLRKAVELFPNFGAAHYGLARTYERLGNKELSLEEFALYDRNRNSAPEVRDKFLDEVQVLSASVSDPLRPGLELARQGKLGEAAAALEKALKTNRQLVDAHVRLVALYGQLGQPARAEEHFQEAVRLDPRNAESYFNHGLLLASQQEFRDAAEAFRTALEINPQYPGARLNLGSMWEAQGNLQEAVAAYQKALEDNPNDPQAQFDVGRVLVNQEKYPEGIQHLLQSLNTTNEDRKPTYLYALGAAYARSGDRTNGLRCLHLAREEATARGQTQLVQTIDADLHVLETEGRSP